MNGAKETYTLEVVRVCLQKERDLYSEKPISYPRDAAMLVAEEIAGYDREVMCVLNLDTKNRVLNMNIASVGTLNQALAHPREIFKSAILSNAASIFLLHSHPSGVAAPSREDYQVTERMSECGLLLGIPLLDHVIVGGGGRVQKLFSFMEHGFLNPSKGREPAVLEEKALQNPLRKKTAKKRGLRL